MTEHAKFDRALERLIRNLTLVQVAVDKKLPAALFSLQIEALDSALEDVKALLAVLPSDYPCAVAGRAFGEATAALLAEALAPVTPDTIPDDWKE